MIQTIQVPKYYYLHSKTNLEKDPFFKLFFSLNNYSKVFSLLLDSDENMFSYFLETKIFDDHLDKCLLNCAYYGKFEFLELILKKRPQFDEEILEKAVMLVVVRNNMNSIELGIEKLEIYVTGLLSSFNLIKVYYIVMEKEKKIDYYKIQKLLNVKTFQLTKFLAFFGEISALDEISDLSTKKIYKILLMSLKGLSKLKKYHNSSIKVCEIFAKFQIFFDATTKIIPNLEENSSIGYSLEFETFVSLSLKFNLYSFLVS